MARDPLDVIIDDVDSILSSVSEKEFNGKRVLITGASGLLGFYFTALFRRLCEMGGGPIKVDLVVHSAPIRVLSRLANFPGASILIGDLTNAEFLSKLEQYDYIVHAAGYGQPGRFMENQIKTIQLNTTTTIQLFNNLAIGGRYLFVSTSELYSGLSNPPFVEEQIGNTNTTHARACYIEAKRCGEAICNAYRKQGVAAVSARLALAYGPGTKANDQRVLNSFIQRGLTNGQIELRDMGKAQRTYCYVANAVEILFNIMRNGSHPVYNVGGISRTDRKSVV